MALKDRFIFIANVLDYAIMLYRWIPWKFFIKRAARAYGFIDPLTFLARIRQFSQPSEVQEPIELVRAGIAFHTRGLINTKAIQHNLDWVWPYWVERQFNPNDSSFIPRAFSFSHVNLTHRNWTAVGTPALPLYPIVDPRGLVTPLYDGWSLDMWLVTRDGRQILPSKLDHIKQQLHLSPNLMVETTHSEEDLELSSRVRLELRSQLPVVEIEAAAHSRQGGWLIIALRPYNPEGIQFIESITPNGKHGWQVNETSAVEFNQPPEKMLYSNYEDSDVIHKLDAEDDRSGISCQVGMATAAALFRLDDGQARTVTTSIPLGEDLSSQHLLPLRHDPATTAADSWSTEVAKTAVLKVPDPKIQFLYDAAVRTMLLLSADDLVPGPYTYRRFWFRDACLMLNALLAAGLTERSLSVIDSFFERQKVTGYFQSQEGEWDSNGQVLWIMDRFQRITNHTPPPSWMKAVIKGADWISRKRITKKPLSPHYGLLPPGFSAEHLGPNDYYYWDDFWSLAGLRGAARLAGLFHSYDMQRKYQQQAEDLQQCLTTSIENIADHRAKGGIPASPYRRLDAGAIGSLVADYPLHIAPPQDERIQRTADFLMENCFHNGTFFQDMIHSGSNIYLTLDIAQTLLRNNDYRYRQLIDNVADLATPTGQWPEAIHPFTQGGCMGDGQHGWAAAEWFMMVRNLFVREEGDSLVLGSGILPRWIKEGEPLSFGPTSTLFGTVSLKLTKTGDTAVLELETDYDMAVSAPCSLVIDVPGYRRVNTETIDQKRFVLQEDEQ